MRSYLLMKSSANHPDIPIRVAAARVTHSNISSSFSFVLPTLVVDNRFILVRLMAPAG